MRLWVLGSGSRGNALLLESGGHRLLVDAGFAPRTLAQRLRAIGVQPESIGACVLTHEHGDHVRGAASGAARWGWTIHASEGTVRGCAAPVAAERVRPFTPGATLALDGFTVSTHASPHDALAPVCLVATASASGVRAGIAYDLGHVPEPFQRSFHDVELLVLEANHDEEMLRCGPYPASVKRRIASRSGHLSNAAAATFARQCAGPALQQVVLGHLSEQNNDPALAVRTVRAELRRGSGCAELQAAPQHAVIGPISARPRARVRAGVRAPQGAYPAAGVIGAQLTLPF